MKRASSFSTSAISKHPIFSQFSQLSQQSQQYDDKKPFIYFVIPPGMSQEECQEGTTMGDVFQAAQAHFLNVMWVADHKCKDQELHEDGTAFIFETFGTPGFADMSKHLSGSPRVEILGPTLLRQVFNEPQQSTFETREVPTYTLSMKGMIVSFSGFSKPMKEELEKLVTWMNGTLSASLTKAVTHVVTSTALTSKTIEAFKVDIPVMTENWVREVWKDNLAGPKEAGAPDYVKFGCPIFHKVNICLSQISHKRKIALKAAIEKHGGICSSELHKSETHVLVIDSASGEKFRFAQKWKMKCATPEWIENCVEKNAVLATEDYPVPGGVTKAPAMLTSTPAHSMIQNADMDWNMTALTNITDNDSRKIVEASNAHLQCTNLEETLSQLRAAPDTGAYLDGCIVYLVEHEKWDDLKKELNKSGAIRIDQLSERVTHMIVSGTKIPRAVQERLRELDSTPYIVTVAWLVQSAKQGSPADEELFKFDPGETLCNDTFQAPAAPAPRIRQSSHVDRVSVTAFETHISNGNRDSRYSAVVNDSVASSKVTINESGTSRRTSSSSTSSSSSESDTSRGSKSRTRGTSKGTSEVSDKTYDGAGTNAGDTNTSMDVDPEGLLVGLTFQVALDDPNEKELIEGHINSNAGRLVKSGAEIVILPTICDAVAKDMADISHTKYWLLECLQQNALDVEHMFYHNPQPGFSGMNKLMKGVVIAISQYNATEREYILEVLGAMGGIYQELFSRKSSEGRKQSTHLICKTNETDKAKAARKWNVPVVTCDWLIESFQEKRRLEEERFDPANVSVADDRTVFMPTPQRRRMTMNAAKANNPSLKDSSVMPPSTQKKGGPHTMFKKKETSVDTDNNRIEEVEESNKDGVVSEAPSAKKIITELHRDVMKTPPGPSRRAEEIPLEIPANFPRYSPANSDEEDSFLKTLPKCPPQEEIDRIMAEAKAMFPYSDQSFEELKKRMAEAEANGLTVSPFTSFEERRMGLGGSPPDSPILLGLPRHESRALKEQFEIAINRTPAADNMKIKIDPPCTPLSEIVRRYNEKYGSKPIQAVDPNSPASSPRMSSTPMSNLRKVAAINRLSQSNLARTRNDSVSENEGSTSVEGIKRLNNKRPSEESPENDPSKANKRARKSSEVEVDPVDCDPSNQCDDAPNTVTPNEETKRQSRKPNRIQQINNLIAETEQNPPEPVATSPIKRGPGDNSISVPCEGVEEEVERPHLSWGENGDDSAATAKSTVKKAVAKPRIIAEPEPDVPAAVPEPKPAEGRSKRSSKARKASSVVNEDTNAEPVVTRRTRTRSKSKGPSDEPPMGHQPEKKTETKKKKKDKHFPKTFPTKTPCFALSSIDAAEKTEILQIMNLIGATMSKVNHFDPSCDALIAAKLLRSEKVLGCIGAGKLILKPEYLLRCREAGELIPIEKDFVWHEGNVQEDKEKELAKASFAWLTKRYDDAKLQPMANMKFFFVETSAARATAYERLIVASGGAVVKQVEEATVVLKDDKCDFVVPPGIFSASPLYLNQLILKLPE